MALPMFRGCSRLPTTLSCVRLSLNQGSVFHRPGKPRLPASAAPGGLRPYSSHRDEGKHKMVVVALPNPITFLRTRFHYFFIRTFLDKEFSAVEFTEGAKQAFSHVSRLLSECQFEALEGLVESDMIGKLQEQCNLLPTNYKQALSAEPDDIMNTTTGNVEISFDASGRRFVSVLMQFWYLTSARLPDDFIEGSRVFKVAIGQGAEDVQTKTLLTASYEFCREFTTGVAPNWTITKIEHSKLLD